MFLRNLLNDVVAWHAKKVAERETGPQFKHDCDDCVFLGRYDRPGGLIRDLYACPGNASTKEVTFVGRYGDGADKYSSYPDFIANDIDEGWVPEAIKRWVAQR